MKNKWTNDEILFLKHNYYKIGPTLCGERLKLKKSCVQHKALSLGLKYQGKSVAEKTKDFIKKARIIHGDKYDYSKTIFTGYRNKIIIICPTHGEFFQLASSHVIHKQNCSICAKTSLTKKTLIERFKEKHGNKYDYTLVEYTGRECYVKIICKKHGPFSQRYDVHAKGYGCSKCSSSIGEDTIYKFLDTEKIKSIRQKRFEDCKHKKQLPFDFYLPDYNICIEFHGQQHYKPVQYWGGKDFLMTQQLRDKIKQNYCKNNNIVLLVINHNENIINKLTNYFKVVYSNPSLV